MTFIENIFRSRLNLVSSNNIIAIKIDKKDCLKPQENKQTKKIIKKIWGCQMDSEWTQIMLIFKYSLFKEVFIL